MDKTFKKQTASFTIKFSRYDERYNIKQHSTYSAKESE